MSTSSPLLALPPELRNDIYDLVKAEQTDFKTLRITNGSVVLHPLTRTCRQLRRESSSILQPDSLDDTTCITAQVFDIKFDALDEMLSEFPSLDNRVVILHTTIVLTAPGEEDLRQLHHWLAARRAEALHPLANPGHAFDHFNRFYNARIDWTNHSMATANSTVNALAGFKVSNATKGPDASGIHSTVATAAKRRHNELMGIAPGRSMLGIMGGKRRATEASVEAESAGAAERGEGASKRSEGGDGRRRSKRYASPNDWDSTMGGKRDGLRRGKRG
ncbi:hypothetical protein LTR08_002894 [Meristemomyces frigidus]|nr:hypothetical protein LTR08_002894 [Meristemomyces frigidus]